MNSGIPGGLIELAVELLAVIIVGVIAFKLKTVDLKGFIAGVIVGSLILIFGGLKMFILLLTFFTLSSLATKFKYEEKRAKGVAENKGGKRSIGNVLGNGLTLVIIPVIEYISGSPYWILGYIGAVSAVTADTLATEIGLLSKSKPRLITNLNKMVEPGTPGGVTLLGLMAIIASSLLIGAIAYSIGVLEGKATINIVILSSLLGGIAGSTTDSIVGATLQALYKLSLIHI